MLEQAKLDHPGNMKLKTKQPVFKKISLVGKISKTGSKSEND